MNFLGLLFRLQASRSAAWLLGFRGLALTPAALLGSFDRLRARFVTAVFGLLAMATVALTGLVALVTSLFSATPRPPAWVLLVGSIIGVLPGIRSVYSSRRVRIAVPGAAWIAVVAGGLFIGAAVVLLLG